MSFFRVLFAELGEIKEFLVKNYQNERKKNCPFVPWSDRSEIYIRVCMYSRMHVFH